MGTAIAYPTAKALKFAGNRVISILGARTRELVILEAEMRAIQRRAFSHDRRRFLRARRAS